MNAPKVSVIIPMYNAEKFIRQCLISVLASKFTDYEAIVVDDCSTDSSLAEVEKLSEHFNGRLKILSTQTNSGGAGVPRNVGIKHASGKYVTFVDNDDMILPNALGDFFDAAEKFHADVVHTEKFFVFNDRGETTFRREELILRRDESGEPVDKPTLEPDDLRERIRRCAEGKFLWLPWGKFYRRDFLLENEIDFPQMGFSEDMIFCFKCFCRAKNYLRVPQVTNIHRLRMNSGARKILSSRDGVKLWSDVVIRGICLLNEFMDGIEFFRRNPDVRRAALKIFFDTHFAIITNLFQGLKPHEVEQIFYDELNNPELNQRGKNILLAHMCAERALTR